MKNLKINISILAVLITTALLSSCVKHHHSDPPPVESVVVNIISPNDAQEFEKDDTAFIKARITSPTNLHGYDIKVTRLADTALLIDKHIDDHKAAFDISEFLVNDGSIHTNLELEIKAIIDHDGNFVSKKVQFHFHTH